MVWCGEQPVFPYQPRRTYNSHRLKYQHFCPTYRGATHKLSISIKTPFDTAPSGSPRRGFNAPRLVTLQIYLYFLGAHYCLFGLFVCSCLHDQDKQPRFKSISCRAPAWRAQTLRTLAFGESAKQSLRCWSPFGDSITDGFQYRFAVSELLGILSPLFRGKQTYNDKI